MVFPFSRAPTNDDPGLIVRRTQDPANSQKGWKHQEWRTREKHEDEVVEKVVQNVRGKLRLVEDEEHE